MRTRAIVVGTDGTDASGAAVRWAAREASRRHHLLRIVHAFDWAWHSARYGSGGEYIDVARQLADAVIAAAIDQARAVAPTVSIEADAVIGNAVPQLLHAADGAEFVVVGSRGRGGFTGLLLGSVSRRVATHAPCSVVIVRGRADAAAGPVVVGVDDSPAADGVLATAFEVAESRDCGLVAVHTYLPPVPLWIGDIPASAVDTPEQDAVERARLDELLAPWREKYPAVPAHEMLSHDSAAAALVGVSRGAQLVVVGSRGHGALAGTLLGSTGMQLIHHADCPVLVVRPVTVPETGTPL
jgi:nucleotide-binding universal stress UspA family protein